MARFDLYRNNGRMLADPDFVGETKVKQGASAEAPTLEEVVAKMLRTGEGLPEEASQPVGVVTTAAVAGGAAFTATGTVQRYMAVRRMMVATPIANCVFVIDSIKLGADEQLPGGGSVPAEMFRADSTANAIRGGVLAPGMSITIAGRNVGAAADFFRSAFIGGTFGK